MCVLCRGVAASCVYCVEGWLLHGLLVWCLVYRIPIQHPTTVNVSSNLVAVEVKLQGEHVVRRDKAAVGRTPRRRDSQDIRLVSKHIWLINLLPFGETHILVRDHNVEQGALDAATGNDQRVKGQSPGPKLSRRASTDAAETRDFRLEIPNVGIMISYLPGITARPWASLGVSSSVQPGMTSPSLIMTCPKSNQIQS